jgi:hypothetical protein
MMDKATPNEELEAAIQLGLDDLEAGRFTIISSKEEFDAPMRGL